MSSTSNPPYLSPQSSESAGSEPLKTTDAEATSLNNTGGVAPYSRGDNTFNRPDPPRTEENKIKCERRECAHLVFDRKCEWSKHMDKHDRPYKCKVPGCEKLQGFTYSGGLLRHQREVHKLTGGTKKAVFCHVTGCKRASGTPFTRKANLAEHIRRIHPKTSAESTSTDGQENDEAEDDDTKRDTKSRKRKRDDDDIGGSGSDDVDDPREEIKRLRKEVADKDERVRSVEATLAHLSKVKNNVPLSYLPLIMCVSSIDAVAKTVAVSVLDRRTSSLFYM